MAAIEGGELRLVQSLDDGQNRRVDESDVGIRVTFANLPNSPVITREQLLDPKRAPGDIVEEFDEDTGVQPFPDPVIHLDQHRRGDHQILARPLDQAATRTVMGISPVQGSIHRSSV